MAAAFCPVSDKPTIPPNAIMPNANAAILALWHFGIWHFGIWHFGIWHFGGMNRIEPHPAFFSPKG